MAGYRSILGLTYLKSLDQEKCQLHDFFYISEEIGWSLILYNTTCFFFNQEALLICLQSFHLDAKNGCFYISPFVWYGTKLELLSVMKQFESCKNIISWPRYRSYSESCIIRVTLPASEFSTR